MHPAQLVKPLGIISNAIERGGGWRTNETRKTRNVREKQKEKTREKERGRERKKERESERGNEKERKKKQIARWIIDR
jgi:hypothetical protein